MTRSSPPVSPKREPDPVVPGALEDAAPRRREALASHLQAGEDAAFQACMLEGVSRTFALTIPQLPPGLRHVVANAYLLCRAVDTIEDEPALSAAQKREFCDRFVKVVEGEEPPGAFALDLAPLLSDSTLEAERELIRESERVLGITRGLGAGEQRAVARCVRIMADGMADFQERGCLAGLEDLPEMDRYCYHVAGVVGEMLTELFCLYSPSVAKNRTALMSLAASFGQGLQMTNILKDVWDDRRRGACWLPQSIFREHGFELEADLEPGRKQEAFARGLTELVAIAHGHLRNALGYTLLIPRSEAEIRKFCLWALGMAVLTLDRIHQRPDFTDGSQVKISRKAVRTTITVTNMAVRSNLALKLLFGVAGRRLPGPTFTG